MVKFKLRGLGEDSPVVFIRDAKTTAEAIGIGKHKYRMHATPCMHASIDRLQIGIPDYTIYIYM